MADLAFTHLTARADRGVLVLTILPTRLDDEASVRPIREELLLTEDRRLPRHQVTNLEHVTYLSARAVDALLAHAQRMKKAGGKTRICQAHAHLIGAEPLERLGLLYDVFPTLPEAVLETWH